MKIYIHKTAESMSQQAAQLIQDEIANKPTLTLCAATGNTPRRTYELLADAAVKQPALFSNIRLLKLDEWGGVEASEKGTCENYLQNILVKPLRIETSRYIGFDSNPPNPAGECRRIRNWLAANGPIDLCLLGLGVNGHIAFNEPAEQLKPFCHVAELSESSLRHSMIADIQTAVRYGLTLGFAEILQSRQILLLICGAEKQAITRHFLSGAISTQCPASFLWLHPAVTVLCDEAAVHKIDVSGMDVTFENG